MAFLPTGSGGLFGRGAFQIDPEMTPEQLQRRREMLAAMMPQYGRARYVGEGLGHLATGIMRGRQMRNIEKAEGRERSRINDMFRSLMKGGTATDGAPILGPQPYQPKDPTSPDSIAADTMTALGKRSPYADAIAAVESAGSGDYSAVGPETGKGRAYGRYQVMDFNIGPWTEKYVGKRMTPEEFLASPQAQDAVFNGEFGSYVQKYGNPQDAASMWFSGRPLAAAGNASDGHTTVPQYVDKFTRALGGGPRVMPAGGGMDIGTLAEIAASPYADAGQKAVAQTLLQQQMQAADPKSALELENMRLQNEALRNPPKKDDRTQDMREYDRAVLDFISRGEPVPTFTEWLRGNKSAGAASQTVNLNGDSSPRIGTIPQGYQLVQDAETGAYRMEVIPGGPEDRSAQEAAKASDALTASDTVTTAAQRARDAASRRDFGSAGTSFVANLPIIGAMTDSGEVLRNVEVLKSQASISNLQAMRDASPTGGALGSVTENELKLLQDKSGALDPNSPTFLRDLDDYERTLLRTIHGKDAGDAIFEQTRGGGADADGWQTIDGVRIRVKR